MSGEGVNGGKVDAGMSKEGGKTPTIRVMVDVAGGFCFNLQRYNPSHLSHPQ